MRALVTFYCYIVILLRVGSATPNERISIKIAEGVDRAPDRSTSLLAYNPPGPFWGPDILAYLNGQCFTMSMERFEYTFCPFQNVTQKRSAGSRPTLLGLWGEWTIPDISNEPLRYTKMVYSKGQACGQAERVTTVELECNASHYGILENGVTEIAPCRYQMKFGVPIYCELLGQNILRQPEEKPVVTPETEHASTTTAQTPAQSSAQAASATTDSSTLPTSAASLQQLQQQVAELQNTIQKLMKQP